jgi:hypothetical protein
MIVRVRSGTTGWRGDEARFVSHSSSHKREYVRVEEVLASHKRLGGHTTKEGLTFFLERHKGAPTSPLWHRSRRWFLHKAGASSTKAPNNLWS